MNNNTFIEVTYIENLFTLNSIIPDTIIHCMKTVVYTRLSLALRLCHTAEHSVLFQFAVNWIHTFK